MINKGDITIALKDFTEYVAIDDFIVIADDNGTRKQLIDKDDDAYLQKTEGIEFTMDQLGNSINTTLKYNSSTSYEQPRESKLTKDLLDEDVSENDVKYNNTSEQSLHSKSGKIIELMKDDKDSMIQIKEYRKNRKAQFYSWYEGNSTDELRSNADDDGPILDFAIAGKK